jgi:hypothetical protein
MRKRTIDLVLAIVAATAALLLSWPYFRDFGYWAESPPLWKAYFVAGFVLAVYVFYVFMGAIHTLFAHDALEHAEAARTRAMDQEEPR